jgi:hypothetical protein
MRDIYHHLVAHSPELTNHSDEYLNDYSSHCSESARAIVSALKLVGNLVLDASDNENYSDEDARHDLLLVSDVLRHLPRLAQALEQNSYTAEYVLRQRREGSK